MKKVFKVFVYVLLLALYLNIGWAMGTYTHNHINNNTEPQTFAEKIFAGPNNLFVCTGACYTLTVEQILSMLAWPVLLVGVVLGWVFYFVYLILWLIFAGGIAKILGVG